MWKNAGSDDGDLGSEGGGGGKTFNFVLVPQPVLTTSTNAVAWPQGDQLLGGGPWHARARPKRRRILMLATDEPPPGDEDARDDNDQLGAPVGVPQLEVVFLTKIG